MIKWIRTRRLLIKNSLSIGAGRTLLERVVAGDGGCREAREVERRERKRERTASTRPSRYTPPYSGLYRGM